MTWTLYLSPKGHLRFAADSDHAPLPDALAGTLATAFASGAGHGLLHLGAAAVATALPALWGYWRDSRPGM